MCLRDTAQRFVFHFTPTPASGLNQIELWSSILVRKRLRRGHFLSKDYLRTKRHAFIDSFHTTLAKPFRWTYPGKPWTV